MARPFWTLLVFCATLGTSTLPAPTPTSLLHFPRAECPANTFQCPTDLGPVFSDICCEDGYTCGLDVNNNPACCPGGAVCTGTAPNEVPTGAPNAPVSFVPNSYFSFPYAATTFDSSGACSSALDACSENYDICTANLGGDGDGGYAVTIEVPGGGGVTVGGSMTDLGASATSVCSSLSSEACSNLEATSCDSFGDDSGSHRTQTQSALLQLSFAFTVATLLSWVP